MWKYLQRHEAFVRGALAGEAEPPSFEELESFHHTQIARMQHERLIHLIVTMFVATFFLLSVGYVSLVISWSGVTLAFVLLVLLAAYVLHYFRLENGVQRWYHLANEISARRGGIAARYVGKKTVRSRNG